MAQPEQATKRPSMKEIKEQFRMERHREFLSTALRIVTDEGLSALTMQGLADELDCGIGTLYRHFPSKGVLIAELQREALDIVNMSFRVSQAHLDDLAEAQGLAPGSALVALARAVVAARFWVAAETVFPQEIDLSRRMFIDPSIRMDDDDAGRVVPSALRLLDLARQLLDDAVAAGALKEGVSVQRAIIVIAGTTGVLMTSGLARWDADLFNGQSLAGVLVHDLFLGWGADPSDLASVDDLIATLDAHDHLVPVVRH
jgi:AcrR family transcriptional regulator